MKQNTIDKINNLYTDNLKQHGLNSKSVGWPNEADHLLRFEKLFTGFEMDDITSLNDLGSGWGAVLNFLASNNIFLKRYFAYEISQDMLDNIDVKKHKKTAVEKYLKSQLETVADVSIASGIFNVKFEESNDLWLDKIIKTLHNLNENSSKVFSFNLLSTYVDFQKDHLYYGDPLFFFDYCKKNFSRKVSLFHDYPLWEWTIVVKK